MRCYDRVLLKIFLFYNRILILNLSYYYNKDHGLFAQFQNGYITVKFFHDLKLQDFFDILKHSLIKFDLNIIVSVILFFVS